MATLLTPGVYFERSRAEQPPPAVLGRTDVAGIVGIAERGPLHEPIRVTSFRQFQDSFGGFLPYAHLAYAVRAFFENGGAACWVVRVADEGAARAATASIPDTDGGAAYLVEASSPDTWGDDLAIQVLPATVAIGVQDPSVAGLEFGPGEYWLALDSVAGFVPGSWVRLSQDETVVRRVRVAEVDLVRRLLRLEPPADPADLDPLDPAAAAHPIGVESIEFTVLVLRAGQVAERLGGLAPDAAAAHDAQARVTAASQLVSLTRAGGAAAAFPVAPWGGPLEGRLSGGIRGLSSMTVFDHTGVAGRSRGVAQLAAVDEVAILLMPDLHAPREAPVATRALQPAPLDRCDPRLGGQLATIAGTVRDAASGLAVAGVTVEDGRGAATTDDGGAFSLGDQVPGSVVDVRFVAAGYEDALVRVNVDDPAATTLDITLAPLDLPPLLAEDDVFYAQRVMVAQCEDLNDRFAIVDAPPPAAARSQLSHVLSWRARFDSPHAALYYPWLRVADPLRPEAVEGRAVPPSGHVAGVYARTDLDQGVHRPPANRALRWVDALVDDVDDAAQGLLHPAGVNAVRPFAGRGIRVFGARTTGGGGTPLRYVNVRRLLSAVAEAVLEGMQWAVFEPNDAGLRLAVRMWLTNLADTLWRAGALAGAAPDEAYRVRCDATTTSEDDAANGRLIALVDLAPTIPYEFVVVRLGITRDEIQVSEVDA